MTGWSPDLVRWEQDGDVVLWQRATGRHVRLPPAALERLASGAPGSGALRQRLEAEHLLGDVPLEIAPLVACRNRLPLLLPDEPALWVPVPAVHTAGGRGWRALPLTFAEVALWRAINDARTVARVAATARVGEATTRAFFARLTAPDVQAVQLRASPPRAGDPSLLRTVGAPRPAHERTPDQHGTHGETTLGTYHRDGIHDGSTHFDDRETTVAHVHAAAHPALGGRTYGEALHDGLAVAGMLPASGWVVEVGCGTGRMAADLHGRAQPPSWRYLRVDLSPELLRTQAANARGTLGVFADGTALPLRDASVDLLVSNEVIADLSAVPWAPGDEEGAPGAVGARIARYGLSVLPGRGPYNLGAWRLVEEAARVLKPGGHAWISEFGALDSAPEEADQLDHPETSIHFGHLLAVARALGLDARIERLDDWLGMDLSARHLWRPHHHALRALAARHGLPFPARAWTEEGLEAALPSAVEGLRFVPVADEGAGPLATRFHVLVATRS